MSTGTFDPTKYTKSRWIKGADLQPGRPTMVTINAAFEQNFEQQNETKPALSFDEIDQSLILNKTQVKTMLDLFGNDPRAWVGQRINLLQVPSNYQGKPTILITSAESAPPTGNGQPPRQPSPAGNAAMSREDVAARQQQQPPQAPDHWPTEPPAEEVMPF